MTLAHQSFDSPRHRSHPRTIDESTSDSRGAALRAYGGAWTQTDEDAIRSHLSECWAADGTYVNPFIDPVRGIHALIALILDYQLLFPGARITPLGRPVLHHHYANWRWALSSSVPIRIRGTDFGTVLSGQDIITFDEHQRIASAIAFFDQRRTTRTTFARPLGGRLR